MRTLKISSSVTAALLLVPFLTIATFGQDPNRNSGDDKSQTRVVVIDVERVLDSHPKLKPMLEDLRSDKDAFQAEVQKELAQIEQMKEELQQYKPGTPEFDKLEEIIARSTAHAAADVELKTRRFTLREARIRYKCYEEIVNEVSHFAAKYGLDLVLNWRGGSVNKWDAAAVEKTLRRQVVWHDEGVDITDEIIKKLTPEPRRPGTSSQPNVPAPRR